MTNFSKATFIIVLERQVLSEVGLTKMNTKRIILYLQIWAYKRYMLDLIRTMYQLFSPTLYIQIIDFVKNV